MDIPATKPECTDFRLTHGGIQLSILQVALRAEFFWVCKGIIVMQNCPGIMINIPKFVYKRSSHIPHIPKN